MFSSVYYDAHVETDGWLVPRIFPRSRVDIWPQRLWSQVQVILIFEFNGNMSGGYCGPWWSDYQVQGSVAGYGPARSEFDQTCKDHDAAYARARTPQDFEEADRRFYQANYGKSTIRSAAATAVKYGGKFFHSRKRPMLRSRTQSNVTYDRPPTHDPRLNAQLQYGDPSGYTSDFGDYPRVGNAAQKRKRPMSKTRTTPSPNIRSRHFSNKKARFSPYTPMKRVTSSTMSRNLFSKFRAEAPTLQTRLRRTAFYQLPRVVRRNYAAYKQAQWRRAHYRRQRARRLSLAYKRRAHFLKYRRARAYRRIAPAFRRWRRKRLAYKKYLSFNLRY